MEGLYKKLGFDQILVSLSNELKLTENKNNYKNLFAFMDKTESVQKLQKEVSEGGKLLQTGISFIERDFSIITDLLERLSIQGTVFFESEFKQIQDLLSNIDLVLFAINKNDEIVHLKGRFSDYEFPSQLFKELNHYILPDGSLNLQANRELNRVSGAISKISKQIRGALNGTLSKLKEKGKVSDDSQITIYTGRLVIPVLSEYKREVEGIIHDVSSTGQTTYIEPKVVINLNNELRELEIEKRRIVYSIFSELTELAYSYAYQIEEGYKELLKFDSLLAVSSLSLKLGGVESNVVYDRVLELSGARNPLLVLKEGKEAVVPFDIKLNYKDRVLIISGPNAGGKSVLLKTIGLYQLMLRIGVLLPVESANIHLFNGLFVDIGDDQSVEDELSTYTAHISNMVTVLNEADEDSLFLFDEFGAGTDPDSGGKIAAEILNELNTKKVFGVVSTHYEDIKALGTADGCLSGSMQFDSDSLKPLYRLNIGTPGRSYAFEVAQNTGMSPVILEKAKSRFALDHLSYEKRLEELNKREVELASQADEIKEKAKAADKVYRQYKELVDFYDKKKEQLLTKAKKDVDTELLTLRREIGDIKKLKKKGDLAGAKEKINKVDHKLIKLTEKKEPVGVPLKNPEVGAKAKIKGSGNVGEILSVKGNKVELKVGGLIVKANLNSLLEVKEYKNETYSKSNVNSLRNKKAIEFKTDLDIRGKRAEESIVEIETFVDQALLASALEIRIIHGKGNGVLRSLVHTVLKDFDSISSIRFESNESGGNGVTIASFA